MEIVPLKQYQEECAILRELFACRDFKECSKFNIDGGVGNSLGTAGKSMLHLYQSQEMCDVTSD